MGVVRLITVSREHAPMNSKSLKRILQFREERDWKQFHLPKNLAISLALESAEVLELFQWTKDNNLPADRKGDLEAELADVYYWLLLLAHEFDIDLDKVLAAKMKVNALKYPVEKSKGKSTKYHKL
jgi:NTP pyrophosphatase (non-canonical NTP hydrolase)